MRKGKDRARERLILHIMTGGGGRTLKLYAFSVGICLHDSHTATLFLTDIPFL